MPTRSYFFPLDFLHIEAILRSENAHVDEELLHRFRKKDIAPLLSSLDIATVLGVGPGLIYSIIRKPLNHYRSFPLVKRDGSSRNISAPRVYLKVIQWWILDNILSRLPTPDYVFGFAKGKSIQDNAKFHAGAKHLLNVDIKSFFDTVTAKQVFLVFKNLGYEATTAITLARLCTLNNCLPQGAPTSPSIANLVLSELDININSLAIRHCIKYSRYADDLTFSSNNYIETSFCDSVLSLVKAAGFELKPEKTRYAGSGSRMEITGLIAGSFVQPPLDWRKKNRSRLHHLSCKATLDVHDHAYLLGLKGYAMQFPEAPQMRSLLKGAQALLGSFRPLSSNSLPNP
jgi:RNA-directed DNA polymerase